MSRRPRPAKRSASKLFSTAGFALAGLLSIYASHIASRSESWTSWGTREIVVGGMFGVSMLAAAVLAGTGRGERRESLWGLATLVPAWVAFIVATPTLGDPSTVGQWLLVVTAIVLVLLGGATAGGWLRTRR